MYIPVGPTKQNFLWLPESLYTLGLGGANEGVGTYLHSTTVTYGYTDITGATSGGPYINDWVVNNGAPAYDNILVSSFGGNLFSRMTVEIDFFNH